MESAKFKVILTGHLLEGFDPDQVAEGLSRIFDIPARRFIRLFAGEPFPIKKVMSEDNAQRLLVRLKVAGADCRLEELKISEPKVPQETPVKTKGRPVSGLLGSPRYRLLAVLSVVLVAVGAGSGMYFSGDADPLPGQPSVDNRPMTPQQKAQKGLDHYARSIRIWMLQFGGTFDAEKVTIERLKEDLELADGELIDPWGGRYLYEPEGRRFTVRSAGPDRKPNSPDDLIVKSGF